MTMADERDITIHVQSMYGTRTRKGLVMLRFGEEFTMMPPAKAREIAAMLLECAEAAEGDEFLMRFLTERLKASDKQAAQILVQLRKEREKGAGA